MEELEREYDFGKLGMISGGVILFGVALYFLLRKKK